MASYSDGVFTKFFIFVLLCQVLSLAKPFTDGNSVIKEIFSESKREVPSGAGPAVIPLFKTALVNNPYLLNPTLTPGKSALYSFLSSPELQQSRLILGPSTAINFSDSSLISAYFKAKKNEFLVKLMEKLMNPTMDLPSEKNSRSTLTENDETSETELPSIDSSFFLKKKTKFLETLFKMLAESNMSSTVPGNETQSDDNLNTYTTPSTPKPTIVPPDFWFPFTKLGKTPKPPKPPKPTKAPKAKKVLKEALDTILLQSLLTDLGMDPQQMEITKRATAGDTSPKNLKSKKFKSGDLLSSVNSATQKLYSTDSPVNTLSNCMGKLFKILNKTEDESLKICVSPKTTEEYDPNVDEFLNFLFEIFKEQKFNSLPTKTENLKKPKSTSSKKLKRSTFLDELFHRISTTPLPMTTTESLTSLEEYNDVNINCTLIKEFVNECLCENKLTETADAPIKARRSLIFRPFGLGYWIPQYIYAAKMGMYLDKLMDSINTAAATDVENTVESSNVLKRSLNSSPNEDTTGLPSKEAALKLIISELSELKNSLIEAFLEGIKAQKDALPTQKSYGTSGKSFKKPFWGGNVLPTTDPVAPIQKRIDVLNDVFDKLTMVENTLIFTSEPEFDPKLLANLTEILKLTSSKPKTSQLKNPYTKVPNNSEPYSDLLSKIKEYLLNQSMDNSDNK